MHSHHSTRIANPTNTKLQIKALQKTTACPKTKPSSKRSLSLTTISEEILCNNSPNTLNQNKILELKAILSAQENKKNKIIAENHKIKSKISGIASKEQKILKKQNLFDLKGNTEGVKQETLKKECQESNKISEQYLLIAENIVKTYTKNNERTKVLQNIENEIKSDNQNEKDIKEQLLKDESTNKGLILIYKALKSKYLLLKSKYSIKKDLKQKQSDQIKSINKLIKKLINLAEESKKNEINLSRSINLFPTTLEAANKELTASLCDIKKYIGDKTEVLSASVIKYKQEIRLLKRICKKSSLESQTIQDSYSNMIQSLYEGIFQLKSIEKLTEAEELLKNKQNEFLKLEEMLEYWVKEYSKLVTVNEISETGSVMNLEIEL